MNLPTKDQRMTISPVFLIITATPNIEKMPAVQGYLSQIMPVMMAAGGKPVADTVSPIS
jgi:hypothetical protein